MLLAPSGFDRIVVLETGPRHILLSWDPPASPNGILVNYTVILGGVTVALTTPTTLEYNVTGLLPFTTYNFSVMVCTSVGCVNSQLLVATTMEDGKKSIVCSYIHYVVACIDLCTVAYYMYMYMLCMHTKIAICLYIYCHTIEWLQFVCGVRTLPLSFSPVPEGLSAPFVSGNTGQPVVIVIIPPLSPNGVILRYIVERRDPDSNLTTIGIVVGSASSLTVGDITTEPFTVYAYRALAENSAGVAVSPFSIFLTPEAGNNDSKMYIIRWSRFCR